MTMLQTSVRKGDTQEDVEWHVSCTGQVQASLCSSSGSTLARQLTGTLENHNLRLFVPQTPKTKAKTDKQRQREQEKAECELQKQEEARERQRKTEEKEEEKKAKKDERANRKRKEEEDKLAAAAAAASPPQKQGAVEGLQGTFQRGVPVGLSRSNSKSNNKWLEAPHTD